VPRVKAALDLGPGWKLDVEGVELTWRATAHQVELRARGLRIAPPGDGASVSLAGARIRLNRAALLRGHVVLTAIELDARRSSSCATPAAASPCGSMRRRAGARNLDGVGGCCEARARGRSRRPHRVRRRAERHDVERAPRRRRPVA
jgi:hypothetical protein